MPTVIRSTLTGLLHVGLLLSVSWQLLASELVDRPRAGQPGNLFYAIHEVVGLTTLALVAAFWLWALLRRRETPLVMLVPWLHGAARVAVLDDFKTHLAQLRRRQLPAPAEHSPLASAVHGLGLLAALGMATSGAWLFTQDVPGGLVLEAHELLSNLMWAYLVGHAGVALLYQLTGQSILRRIFARNTVSRSDS